MTDYEFQRKDSELVHSELVRLCGEQRNRIAELDRQVDSLLGTIEKKEDRIAELEAVWMRKCEQVDKLEAENARLDARNAALRRALYRVLFTNTCGTNEVI